MDFGDKIEEVYSKVKAPHPSEDTFNTEESIKNKLQKIIHRKKTNFTSTISDER